MKTLNNSVKVVLAVLMLFGLFGSNSNVGAQYPVGNGPGIPSGQSNYVALIKNEAALLNYQYGRVVRGYMSVQSDNFDWSVPNMKNWADAVGTGAEDVMTKLLLTQLNWRLTSSVVEADGNVWLYDENNNVIFAGYSKMGFSSATSKPSFSLSPQVVPILNAVTSANLQTLDLNGIVVGSVPLQITPLGQADFWPTQANSINGKIQVQFANGFWWSYSLSDHANDVVVVDSGKSNVPFVFDGHYTYKDSDAVKGIVEIVVTETYYDPTVYLNFAEGHKVSVDAVGIIWVNGKCIREYPSELTLVRVSDGFTKVIKLTDRTATHGDIGAGEWRGTFKWNKYGLNYLPLNNGKG